MKSVKKCPICRESKKKRSCKLQLDELICVSCCLEKQSYFCHGCSFYKDVTLKFKCVSCGKMLIDDQPSDITKLMGTKIFKLKNLEGNNLENRFAVSGEIYTTLIEFPFEGKPNTPIWFYYDPDDSFDTLQMIQGEILAIQHFDEYKAKVEIFVHQTSECGNIKNIFSEEEMPESLYDVDCLFPIGSLKMQNFGIYVLVSSMIQDGGSQALIIDDGMYSRIIFYAEGFFNHWQEYAGNIRVKKSFLQQILNDSKCRKIK